MQCTLDIRNSFIQGSVELLILSATYIESALYIINTHVHVHCIYKIFGHGFKPQATEKSKNLL